MNRSKPHILLGVFVASFIGVTLTLSTLHSHQHISWDHPPEMADTGHCLTEDATLCPIGAYLFDPIIPAVTSAEIIPQKKEVQTKTAQQFIADYFSFTIKGRSPPVLG